MAKELTSAEALKLIRPKTRGDCENGIRPCPFVGCRYHLLLDLNSEGVITLPSVDGESPRPKCNSSNGSNTSSFEDDAVDHLQTMSQTCALDVADKGEITLQEIADLMGGLSRERIRQIEATAMIKIKKKNKKDL